VWYIKCLSLLDREVHVWATGTPPRQLWVKGEDEGIVLTIGAGRANSGCINSSLGMEHKLYLRVKHVKGEMVRTAQQGMLPVADGGEICGVADNDLR